ncbi:MAG: heavy-metal-associated domain-containing protein [Rhodoferax sp.]
MIRFDIQDMTCGHCASTITRAVRAEDPQARVHIDLAAHRVDVEQTTASAEELRAAIQDAGYTPVVPAAG